MLNDDSRPLGDGGDGSDDSSYEEEGGVYHQDLKRMSNYKDSGQTKKIVSSKTQKSHGNSRFPFRTLIWAITVVSLISIFLFLVKSGTLDIKVEDRKIEVNIKKNE